LAYAAALTAQHQEEVAMSSTAAPALRGVGVWAAPGTSTTPPRPITRGAPSPAELRAFERAVRPSWWRALWPFYTTVVLGAAVVLVASEASAPVTVRRMFTPNTSVQRHALMPAPARDEYQLPAHWRAAIAPSPAPCEPMSGVGC
jgi:hypothetical protein